MPLKPEDNLSADAASKPRLPPSAPGGESPSQRRPPSDRHPDRMASAPSGVGGRVSPFVAEIRDKLAEIAAREAAVRLRERKLQARGDEVKKAARETVARELESARQRLQKRSAELDAQAVELSTRAAGLDALEERLREERHEQQRARRDLELTDQQRELRGTADRNEREQTRRRLERRVEAVRLREAELKKRIELARDDIARQRKEIDELRADLERQAADLDHRRKETDAIQERWSRRITEIDARAAGVEQQNRSLKGRRGELDARGDALRTQAEALKAQKREIAEARRAASNDLKRERERRCQLEKHSEAIDAKQRALQEEHAALQERLRLLDENERVLQRDTDALRIEREALRDAQVQLEQREAAMTELEHRARKIEQEAERRREEALNLREQTEDREAESRQTALALEVEQQQIAQERAALELSYDELADLRTQREREFQRAREALRERTGRVAVAERSALAAPKLWWLRGSAIAGVAALLVGIAWWSGDTSLYVGAAELQIASASTAADRVAGLHATAILAPGLIEDDFEDPQLQAAWATARAAGRLSAVATRDAKGIRLEIVHEDAGLAQRLAKAAAEAYAARVNGVPAGEVHPALYADLSGRRQMESDQLNRVRSRHGELRSKLIAAPDPSDRDRKLADVRALRAENTEVIDELLQARDTLTEMNARGAPRGTLQPEALERTLARDAAYREDRKELELAGRQYGQEVAVSMVPMGKPLARMQTSLRELARVLDEQRELQPPPEIALLLDESAGDLEGLTQRVQTFARQWSRSSAAVDRLRDGEAIVELVQQQTSDSDAARALVRDVDAAVATLRNHVEALTNGRGGQTRGIVVATQLRTALNALSDPAAGLTQAAHAIDANKNFRLDATDRQLRGLRERLNRRRETIRRGMQLEADRLARQRYNTELKTLRERIESLAGRRDTLAFGLVEGTDELRRLDEQLANRTLVARDIDAAEREIERLETQLARLDEQLAEARRSGPKPDRIEIAAVEDRQVAGAFRGRNASLAGMGTFLLTWLICVLMILKNPLRRRDAAGIDESIESPTSGVEARDPA